MKLIHLQLHKNLPKNSVLTILLSFGIWSKLERWKSSVSGYFVSWLQIKKNCHFEVSSLVLRSEPSLSLWRVMKSGFYTIARGDLLGGWSPKKLQSTTQSHACPKRRVMVAVRCSAAGLICYNFLIPRETITFNYAQQSQWDALKTARPTAGIVLQNGPSSSPWWCLNSSCTTNTSEVEQIGLQHFASSAVFTWPFANQLPLLQASRQLFCRENASKASCCCCCCCC